MNPYLNGSGDIYILPWTLSFLLKGMIEKSSTFDNINETHNNPYIYKWGSKYGKYLKRPYIHLWV